MRIVHVPGIDGSGPDHWQTRWEQEAGGDVSRIAPSSWEEPELDDWCAALDAAVADKGQPVLVAHSLGCLAVAEWLARGARPPAGVFLVAPPDTGADTFPRELAPSFVGRAGAPIPCPGLLVYSANDPYCSPEHARALAIGWQIPGLEVGRFGHINTTSGLGDWRAGRDLLTAFTAGLGPR